jgi:hypothetical protein
MIGGAAVAIWCDVALEVRDEFNHWHAHEHMPERLGIPGFLRGSRWVADEGEGYFILYETQSASTITGPAYLERLNNPTPWSRQMMPHHRNMVRGPCRIAARYGAGLGQALLTVRFSPLPGKADALRAWLDSVLAALPARKGLVSSALLHHLGARQLTAEQELRGKADATPDWVVLVNGYSAEAVAGVLTQEFSEAQMAAHGATPGCVAGLHRLAFVLAAAGYTERPEEAA